MSEIDMSRPGVELFPEVTSNDSYNSYSDAQKGHDVGDPLNMGVKPVSDDAGQERNSKEQNFEALRGEISKMKEEREYWKGKAEGAVSVQHQAVGKPQQSEPDVDPYKGWDMDYAPTGKDVKSAFEAMREENNQLRNEIKDSLAAISTKSQRADWNQKVTEHVPKLTSSNPLFAEMINNVSNPYEAAYLLAELNAKASQPSAAQQPPVNGNAHRAMQNAQKPGSPNTVGGQGTLSATDYYASMSDKEFMEMASKNMENI